MQYIIDAQIIPNNTAYLMNLFCLRFFFKLKKYNKHEANRIKNASVLFERKTLFTMFSTIQYIEITKLTDAITFKNRPEYKSINALFFEIDKKSQFIAL